MIQIPAWIASLHPMSAPQWSLLDPAATVYAWHIRVEFEAVELSSGTPLTRADNWNGKALVVGRASGLNRSVGEVELAAHLRSTAECGWTGKPASPWSKWSLDAATRRGWFGTLDRQVRATSANLRGHAKGIPDVVGRLLDGSVIIVEYKGPSPSNPHRQDAVKPSQVAWMAAAVASGLVPPQNVAVVEWRPSTEDVRRLGTQAAASRAWRQRRS